MMKNKLPRLKKQAPASATGSLENLFDTSKSPTDTLQSIKDTIEARGEDTVKGRVKAKQQVAGQTIPNLETDLGAPTVPLLPKQGLTSKQGQQSKVTQNEKENKNNSKKVISLLESIRRELNLSNKKVQALVQVKSPGVGKESKNLSTAVSNTSETSETSQINSVNSNTSLANTANKSENINNNVTNSNTIASTKNSSVNAPATTNIENIQNAAPIEADISALPKNNPITPIEAKREPSGNINFGAKRAASGNIRFTPKNNKVDLDKMSLSDNPLMDIIAKKFVKFATPELVKQSDKAVKQKESPVSVKENTPPSQMSKKAGNYVGKVYEGVKGLLTKTSKQITPESSISPVDAKPVEAKAIDAKPVDVKPVEAKAESAQTQKQGKRRIETKETSETVLNKIFNEQRNLNTVLTEKATGQEKNSKVVQRKIDDIITILRSIEESIGTMGDQSGGISLPDIGGGRRTPNVPRGSERTPTTPKVEVPKVEPPKTPTPSTSKPSMGSKVLKGAGVIGLGITVAEGAYEGYTGWNDASEEAKSSVRALEEEAKAGKITPEQAKKEQEKILATETEKKSSAVAGGGGLIGGAVVGGTLGAKAGAAIGTLAGPIGTVAGGLIGGAIGGTVGAVAGSEMGKTTGKYAAKAYNTVKGFFGGGDKKESEGSAKVVPKQDELSSDFAATFSEATLAKNDPETHKKFVEFRNQQYQKIFKERSDRGDVDDVDEEIARIQAKQIAVEKFKKEIEAAGAGSTSESKVVPKAQSNLQEGKDTKLTPTGAFEGATAPTSKYGTLTSEPKATAPAKEGELGNSREQKRNDEIEKRLLGGNEKSESKVVPKQDELSSDFAATFSEATFAEKDPENHKKFKDYYKTEYNRILKDNPLNDDVDEDIARIEAKTATIKKFQQEIEAAGAFEGAKPKVEYKAQQETAPSFNIRTPLSIQNISPQSKKSDLQQDKDTKLALTGAFEGATAPTSKYGTLTSEPMATSKVLSAVAAQPKQIVGAEMDAISKQNSDMQKTQQTSIVQPIITNTSTSTNTQSMVPIKAGVRYESSYSRMMERNYAG